MIQKEVHATCIEYLQQADQTSTAPESQPQPYRTVTRIRRLYEILQTELLSPITSLAYITAVDSGEKH
ncbi:hypothetical protein [Leptodesmis sp.]|uniref:hypothetical protein n=1 Tax=Leptodesmis sp. TaxID=3100501 RepID=UPI00405358DC